MSIDGFQRSADPGQHDSVDAPPADRGEVPRSVSIQASTETDPEIRLLEQTLRARAGVGARSRRRAGLPAFLWRVHEVRLLILIVLLILLLVVIFLLILLFFGDLSWPFCCRSCLPFNRRLTGH